MCTAGTQYAQYAHTPAHTLTVETSLDISELINERVSLNQLTIRTQPGEPVAFDVRDFHIDGRWNLIGRIAGRRVPLSVRFVMMF